MRVERKKEKPLEIKPGDVIQIMTREGFMQYHLISVRYVDKDPYINSDQVYTVTNLHTGIIIGEHVELSSILSGYDITSVIKNESIMLKEV